MLMLLKHEEVKAAITLGFTADPLIRWIFPDPQKYLRSFAVWMDEFSKPAFENGGVFADENYYGGSLWHPPGIHLDSEILAPTFADIPEVSVNPDEGPVLHQLSLDGRSILHRVALSDKADP